MLMPLCTTSFDTTAAFSTPYSCPRDYTHVFMSSLALPAQS